MPVVQPTSARVVTKSVVAAFQSGWVLVQLRLGTREMARACGCFDVSMQILNLAEGTQKPSHLVRGSNSDTGVVVRIKAVLSFAAFWPVCLQGICRKVFTRPTQPESQPLDRLNNKVVPVLLKCPRARALPLAVKPGGASVEGTRSL